MIANGGLMKDEMNMLIDFSKIADHHRRELMELIDKKAKDQYLDIMEDLETYSEGPAKKDMQKWADEIHDIACIARAVRDNWNRTVPKGWTPIIS